MNAPHPQPPTRPGPVPPSRSAARHRGPASVPHGRVACSSGAVRGRAAAGLRYVEAPQPYEPDGRPSLFLAGATIGCPDWQSEAVDLLTTAGFEGTVLNPRPSRTRATDPYRAWRPFGWQDTNIRRCSAVLFWNPIGPARVQDCYEAGLFTPFGGAVVVGSDPADPVQQANRVLLAQCMPWLPVADTLAATVEAALAALGPPDNAPLLAEPTLSPAALRPPAEGGPGLGPLLPPRGRR
ncbi:hypothetical protein ACWC5I_17045 [Kitasatospora sp. NPDC001574]